MVRIVRLLAVGAVLLGFVLATPARAADFYYATGVASPYPGQYTDETVLVDLAWDYDGYQPISGVYVHTVWNYRTTTSYADGYTGSDGFARLTRNISGATCGYTVRVDIFVSSAQRQIDSAYFTPCGGGSASYAPAYTSSPQQPDYYEPTPGHPTDWNRPQDARP